MKDADRTCLGETVYYCLLDYVCWYVCVCGVHVHFCVCGMCVYVCACVCVHACVSASAIVYISN